MERILDIHRTCGIGEVGGTLFVSDLLHVRHFVNVPQAAHIVQQNHSGRGSVIDGRSPFAQVIFVEVLLTLTFQSGDAAEDHLLHGTISRFSGLEILIGFLQVGRQVKAMPHEHVFIVVVGASDLLFGLMGKGLIHIEVKVHNPGEEVGRLRVGHAKQHIAVNWLEHILYHTGFGIHFIEHTSVAIFVDPEGAPSQCRAG